MITTDEIEARLKSAKALSAFDIRLNRQSRTPLNLGMGIFDTPIYEFNKRFIKLGQTNPELMDNDQLRANQLRAANVYFGMLAEQPAPTSVPGAYTENIIFYTNFDNDISSNEWLKVEELLKEYGELSVSTLPDVIIKKMDDPTAAYEYHLKRLQTWLKDRNLWDGIRQALAEQSRKRQRDLATAQEAASSAARALAYLEINKDINAEVAEQREELIEQYNEAKAAESEIQNELNDLEKGVITPKENKVNPLLIGAGIAAAAALAFLM